MRLRLAAESVAGTADGKDADTIRVSKISETWAQLAMRVLNAAEARKICEKVHIWWGSR